MSLEFYEIIQNAEQCEEHLGRSGMQGGSEFLETGCISNPEKKTDLWIWFNFHLRGFQSYNWHCEHLGKRKLISKNEKSQSTL